MVRRAAATAMALATAIFSLGCGDGLSEEEAKVRCDQEVQAKSYCLTDSSYDECMSCQQECGDLCEAQPTCPSTYACTE